MLLELSDVSIFLYYFLCLTQCATFFQFKLCDNVSLNRLFSLQLFVNTQIVVNDNGQSKAVHQKSHKDYGKLLDFLFNLLQTKLA